MVFQSKCTEPPPGPEPHCPARSFKLPHNGKCFPFSKNFNSPCHTSEHIREFTDLTIVPQGAEEIDLHNRNYVSGKAGIIHKFAAYILKSTEIYRHFKRYRIYGWLSSSEINVSLLTKKGEKKILA